MRELTFSGYLTKYVRALSFGDTTRLSTLAEEAAWENPRLREPLLLYALYTDKSDVLLRATKDIVLKERFQTVLFQYPRDKMEHALQSESSPLPDEYKKVWRSYTSQRDRHKGDDHTKELMRKKVLRLQELGKVTNYRIYKELGLNPGNVNAWLKHGTSDKVSLDTARTVLRFVENACKLTQ